ncbi:MAG: prepilin-type N-terminal cleavage/methylation domain-containing protein [Planctomycetota bacterium]|nr:prepilin-type N-terminal cleavage/methylation domain-containing protein [Planctomycetota bacterium]
MIIVAALTRATGASHRSRNTTGRSRPISRRRPRGFTLIETALATIIVGVGVLAMVTAQQAFHKKNSWSTHVSTATALANEIREMTWNLPRHDPVTGIIYDPITGAMIGGWGPEDNEGWVGDFDDLDDFDGDGGGLVFSAELNNGPINARREIIANMNGWAQIVGAYSVDPFDITSVELDASTNMMLMEVAVTYQGPGDQTPVEITRVSWIARK